MASHKRNPTVDDHKPVVEALLACSNPTKECELYHNLLSDETHRRPPLSFGDRGGRSAPHRAMPRRPLRRSRCGSSRAVQHHRDHPEGHFHQHKSFVLREFLQGNVRQPGPRGRHRAILLLRLRGVVHQQLWQQWDAQPERGRFRMCHRCAECS